MITDIYYGVAKYKMCICSNVIVGSLQVTLIKNEWSVWMKSVCEGNVTIWTLCIGYRGIKWEKEIF